MPDAVPNVIVAVPAPKAWWRSRTLWFNAVVAALAAAEGGFSVLQPLLPIPVYQVFTFVLLVGNAVLRAITSRALGA